MISRPLLGFSACFAACPITSTFRAETQTETPSRNSASAIARPIPFVPPVTMATLFSRFILLWIAPAERSVEATHPKLFQLLFQPLVNDLGVRFTFRRFH